MALAITVKYGEKVSVGENLTLIAKRAKGGNRVLLVFDAPKDLKVEAESFKKKKSEDRPSEED